MPSEQLLWLLALLCCLLMASPAKVQAQDAAGEKAKPAAQLILKPRLCIVRRGEDSCTIDVTLRWDANRAAAYCLYRGNSAQPLQCWNGKAFGELVDQLQATGSIPYQLDWSDNGKRQPLDSAVLKVVSIVPEDRRRARRRRHVWSVF